MSRWETRRKDRGLQRQIFVTNYENWFSLEPMLFEKRIKRWRSFDGMCESKWTFAGKKREWTESARGGLSGIFSIKDRVSSCHGIFHVWWNSAVIRVVRILPQEYCNVLPSLQWTTRKSARNFDRPRVRLHLPIVLWILRVTTASKRDSRGIFLCYVMPCYRTKITRVRVNFSRLVLAPK